MPNITLAERIAGQYYDPAVFKTNVYDSGASQDGWVLVENWHKFVSDLRAIYTSVRASSSTISSLVTKLDMDLPANPGSRFPRDVGNPWDENYREVMFYRLDSKTIEHIEALSRISDQSSSSGGGSGVGVNPTSTPSPTSTGGYTSLSSREGVGGSGGGGGIINCGNCCPRYTQVDAALNYTYHFVAAATSKFSMYKRSDFEKEFKLIWLQHKGNGSGSGNESDSGNRSGNGTSNNNNNNCEDEISKLKEELKAAEEDRDKWRDKFEKKPPIGGADTP